MSSTFLPIFKGQKKSFFSGFLSQIHSQTATSCG